MKKTYRNLLLVFVAINFLVSCEDVVNVGVPNGGDRLVIEASINWEKGTTGENQTIKLSTSTAYFSDNPNTPVTGASVTVTKDNDNAQFVFVDQNDGTYVANNFIPVIGQSYSLEIVYNGQTYIATETLMSVTEIINIEQSIEQRLSEDRVQVKIFFNDPADINNYYLGEFLPDNKPVGRLQPLDDKFTNGNQNFLVYNDEVLEVGVTLEINLYGISQRYYDYIQILADFNPGGPFQTIPVQAQGNCKNVNNPDEEVLGYFRLSEVVRTNYTIQ